jgi:serine/threonine protein kinase
MAALCDYWKQISSNLEPCSMTPERFDRVAELFAAALDQPTALRTSYLERASAEDPEVLDEVKRLLVAHIEAGGFLEPSLTETTETLPHTHGMLPPGLVLKSRYRIVREIGQGGFARVYLGQDLGVNEKVVVIKMLRDKSPREWLARKFRAEGIALSRVNHPGVVGVSDQGHAPNGCPFLVLEFVDGPSLASVITEKGMPLWRAAGLLRQIAGALQAAHEQGVYHRDLKPSNIMLRDLKRGQEMPVIIDFGIATVIEVSKSDTPPSRVVGSLPYMAPEQYLGRPEAASDIYSLGVVAYEMLTGRLPFAETTALAHLQSSGLGAVVKPRVLRPGLPEAAEREILTALAHDPKKRQASAIAFGEQIARALVGQERSTVLAWFRQLSGAFADRPFRWSIPALVLALVLWATSPAVARWFNNRGVYFRQGGQMTIALSNYQLAIVLHPGYAEAHYNLGDAYEEVSDYDKAMAEYRRAIQTNDVFYPAYNNLSRLYILQSDFAAALSLLDRAFELKPQDTAVQYSLYKNRGWANLGLRLFGQAERDLKRALALRNDGGAAYCLLAQAQDGLGERDSAVRAWRDCVAFGYAQKDVEPAWRSLAQERLMRFK